jgi:hypothetical protein
MAELFITADVATGFLARSAELGARSACDHVIWRTTQHEVGTRLRGFGAIEQDADEIDFGPLTTAGDAMLKRHRADRVTVQAFLDALLHVVMRLFIIAGNANVVARVVGSHECSVLRFASNSRQNVYRDTSRKLAAIERR